jgi:hypothetical protein
MVLIKEITLKNFREFEGMETNVLVVESKEGPIKMKHTFYLVGIVVPDTHLKGYHVNFTNGSHSGGYYKKVSDLIKGLSHLYKFFYIEIKP